MDAIERIIAEKVRKAGGRVFYVGGCVRDRLLHRENKDIDIEVHGISPDTLWDILNSIGQPLAYGESFGVFSLKGYDIDIAMPRKEKATGKGHRDFEVTVDPFLGYKEAAQRRDFTINAMMEDVLTGEVLDYFNGREDLEKGIIRHIDKDRFIEDPLRVLRAAQFASRFDFTVAEETVELCRTIDISTLSKERIEEELRKALLKGRPSIFFEVLRKMDQLDPWFTEMKLLIGLRQDPVYHPEGDVWVHTMEVIDRAMQYRKEVSDPYSFLLLCLCHDFGKALTTKEIKGRIHAHGHEVEGIPLIRTFLHRFSDRKDVLRYVLNMVPLHMKPNALAHAKPAVKSTNRMFDQAIAPKDLIYFAMCDKCQIIEGVPFTEDSDFLFERYEVYEEYMGRPFVGGDDLIRAGLSPGKNFSDILAYAHKLRLAGIKKESALKQTLAYAYKLNKHQAE